MSQGRHQFENFELDLDRYELLRSGLPVKLERIPMELLILLVEKDGHIVTRQQIIERLWGKDVHLDTDHGINTAIRKIRQALEDDPDQPRFLQTVSRKGYRFIAVVNNGRNGNRSLDPDRSEIHSSPEPSDLQPAALIDSPHPRSRKLLLIGASAIALVVLVAAFFLLQPPHLSISTIKQLTFTGDLEGFQPSKLRSPSITTDGRRLFYSKGLHLYSVPVNGGEESPISTTLGNVTPFAISPDGSTLLAGDAESETQAPESRIWFLPANGGIARPMSNIVASFATWSPDAKAIAFTRGSSVYLTEDEGISSRKLFDVPGLAGYTRFSPDGRILRVTVIDPKTTVPSIWEFRFGGIPHRFLPDPNLHSWICCGEWTRDGRYYLYRRYVDRRLEYWYVSETVLASGSAKPVTNAGVDLSFVTTSPLQDRIFFLGQQSSATTFKYDLSARKFGSFLSDIPGGSMTFSNDGQWMLVVRKSGLCRARADGTDPVPVTDDKLSVLYGRFSPDNKQIAVMAKKQGRPWKIYLLSNEGGALRELPAPIESQADPNWNLEGDTIIFGQPPRYLSEPDVERAIYTYNLKSGSFRKLPNTTGWFSPRISPDGKKLLVLSIDAHKLGIYDIDSGNMRTLLDTTSQEIGEPTWSPDGKWGYLDIWNGKTNLYSRIRLGDGLREDIVDPNAALGTFCSGDAFAPDGTIVFTCSRSHSDIYSLEYH
jgi:DNA-binding winged helix-turn-helix (wHTH) protein/Tol biopolymer transport system component